MWSKWRWNTTWYGGFGGVAGEEREGGGFGFVGLTGSNKGTGVFLFGSGLFVLGLGKQNWVGLV